MTRRAKENLGVLILYAAVSFGYFGWRLLPHPGRVNIGSELYIWSFGWWAHVITSWTNPFVSHDVYAPTGVNIAWTPSAPGLALVFSPLTILFGPVASCNVAALLMPALSAWTAYLLCRYLTRSLWASAVGGYLYGFSTVTLRQQLPGNVNLTAVFLFPLVALVVIKYVRGELTARALAWRVGAMVAFELWISTEFALTMTIALVVGCLLALLILEDARPRLRSAVLPLTAGYALAGVLAAPLIAYVLIGFPHASFVNTSWINARTAGTDLLDFVIPNGVIGLGGKAYPTLAARVPTGDSSYLGIPTLIIVAAFALRARRSVHARVLLTTFFAFAVITLGSTLQVNGHKLITLPWWNAATHVPALNNALPFRFAVYTSLAAAVIVASWMATAKGSLFPRPYVLPLLAVVALVPAVWQSSYPSFHPAHMSRAPFFTDGLYKSCIRRNDIVAIFPFAGHSLLWQAESDFEFRLAAHGLQPFPKHGQPLSAFDADPTVWDLSFPDAQRPTMDNLLGFAGEHHVTRVLRMAGAGYPSKAQLRRFGPTQLVGGMLVSPACGQPSLTTRNLTAYVEKHRYEAEHPSERGYCLGSNFNLIPQGTYPAGVLQGAKRAIFVAGTGLTCPPPPQGYKSHGFATDGVPPNYYRLYEP